jgi:hypothetical protein
MARRVEFSNNMAVVGWVFMSIWLAGLCMITWLYVRDGGFHQFDPLIEVGIMLMFWLFGLGGASHLFGMPRVHITVESRMATIRETLPWSVREDIFSTRALKALPLKFERDSDGDPYYSCLIETPGGRKVLVGGSPDAAVAQALRDRLEAALAA